MDQNSSTKMDLSVLILDGVPRLGGCSLISQSGILHSLISVARHRKWVLKCVRLRGKDLCTILVSSAQKLGTAWGLVWFGLVSWGNMKQCIAFCKLSRTFLNMCCFQTIRKKTFWSHVSLLELFIRADCTGSLWRSQDARPICFL